MPNPTPSPGLNDPSLSGLDFGGSTSSIGYVSGGMGDPSFYNPDPFAPSVDERGDANPPPGFVAQVRYAFAANGVSPDPDMLAAISARLWQDQNYQLRYNLGGQTLPEQNQSELGRDLFSSRSRFPDIAYQAIGLLDQDRLTSAQVDFLNAGGNPALTHENLLSQVTGGNGNGTAIDSIIVDEAEKAGRAHGLSRDQISQLAALAIATAYTESGLNPNAVGDNGHSVGLFQLHDQGMGYGMGDSRYDPRTNAAKALDSLAATFAANPNLTPGQIAAASQRPADPEGYARIVDSMFQQVRGGKLPTGSTTAAKYAGPEYQQAQSIYSQYFGGAAAGSTLSAIVGAGRDKQQMEDYVRSLPSHISGMTMGQYTDLRRQADAQSQALFGHQVTDGMVRELFNSGQTAPIQIKRFMNFLNPNLDPSVYNAIYGAAQPMMRNVWNEQGMDPRYVGAIAAAGGAARLPNTSAAATADSFPLSTSTPPLLDDRLRADTIAPPGPQTPSSTPPVHVMAAGGGGDGSFTP